VGKKKGNGMQKNAVTIFGSFFKSGMGRVSKDGTILYTPDIKVRHIFSLDCILVLLT